MVWHLFNLPSEPEQRPKTKGVVDLNSVFEYIEGEGSAQGSPQTAPCNSSISQQMSNTARFMGDGGIINFSGSNQKVHVLNPVPLIRKKKLSEPGTSMGDGGRVNLSNPCPLIRKRKLSVPGISPAKLRIKEGFMVAKLKKILLDRKIVTMNYNTSRVELKDPLPEMNLHEESNENPQ